MKTLAIKIKVDKKNYIVLNQPYFFTNAHLMGWWIKVRGEVFHFPPLTVSKSELSPNNYSENCQCLWEKAYVELYTNSMKWNINSI